MPSSLFKTAGAKRLLAPTILKLMPESGWSAYLEPMVGGGAVFFALHAAGRLTGKRVILSDVDEAIITLFTAVRDDPVEVIMELDHYKEAHAAAKDSEQFYIDARAEWNDRAIRTPGLQLYLRYAAFNGLWRHNKAGGMNTPWNKKKVVTPPSPETLMDASIALAGVELYAGDFRKFDLSPTALAYLDPPYDSLSGEGFVGYTPAGFTDQDQEELINRCGAWCKSGAHVVYSNAATPKVKAWLKTGWPNSAIYHVMNRRAIAASADARGDVKELLVVGGPTRPRVAR